jgi:hypothetical protein
MSTGEPSGRASWPSRVAILCAALLGLLYVSPVLPDLLRTGLDWPIWIDHPEGLIHTNTGKWLLAPPHAAFVEGASGEFPQYYASLSDTLLNVVGSALGVPAMTVQAVLFGPLLGAGMLLANYFALAAVLHDRRSALVASLLISLGGNASFMNPVEPVSGLRLNTVLHVPFHVISLGTSQSLGWVLLLPTLGSMYLAHRAFSRVRALGSGLLLGTLFYAHTLSFVNAAAVELAYLLLATARDSPKGGRRTAWLAAIGVLAAAFVALVAARGRISFVELAALGTLALAATAISDPNPRFYLWSYGPAALMALPYALLLVRHRKALAAMQGGWDTVQMMTVAPSSFVLFFSAYLLAAALACRFTRDRPLGAWLAAFVAATGLLALNHLWGWSNHPYRYTIDLLFPLAILGTLGLRDAPRRLAAPVAAWLLAVVVTNVWSFASGRQESVRFRIAEPERARFLASVRQVTSREPAAGTRILPPVELTYPRGLVQAAMLMNYSRIPSFIPDYRHVLWPERYHNRMGLYCFLFPGYPNQDYPFGWRACEEELEPPADLLTILDPRLKTGILPVYRIGYAAAPAKPFSGYLKEASPLYGWPFLVETDNGAFVRTDTPSLAGVASLAPLLADSELLTIGVGVASGGPQLVILGGRGLETRAATVLLDGRALETSQRSANWAVFSVELVAGPHVLQLPSLERGPDPPAEYLYFAAVLQRDQAGRYVRLGRGAVAAGRNAP